MGAFATFDGRASKFTELRPEQEDKVDENEEEELEEEEEELELEEAEEGNEPNFRAARLGVLRDMQNRLLNSGQLLVQIVNHQPGIVRRVSRALESCVVWFTGANATCDSAANPARKL